MSAQRSVQVNFQNNTSQTLTLTSSNVTGGEWSSKPPQTIGPHMSASWGTAPTVRGTTVWFEMLLTGTQV